MICAAFQNLMRFFVSAVIALSMTLAPMQAAPTAEPNGTSTAMASMNMDGCKDHPCPCEKTKIPCDMNLGCAMGCVYFQASTSFSHFETISYDERIVFTIIAGPLASFEGLPLRRPPRA